MEEKHEVFGELILLTKPSPFRTFLRYVGYGSIPTILALAAISATLDPYGFGLQEGEELVVAVLWAAVVGFLILFFLYAKNFTVAVYEKGLVYNRRGRKLHEYSYNDIGISNLIERHNHWGVIPLWRIRQIRLSSGAQLTRFSVANFHTFADTLLDVQFNYFTQCLTPENVFKTTISFGNDLELREGQFICDRGLRGERRIPLKHVTNVTAETGKLGSTAIRLIGLDEVRWRVTTLYEISISDLDNLDILMYVVELANSKVDEHV